MKKNSCTLLMDSLELPRIKSMEDMSEMTRLSSRLLYCLSKKVEKHYLCRKIPKHNGGLRELSIPSPTLFIVQKWILVNILNKISPSSRAMAFRKGGNYSTKQTARYHANTLYGLSIDIKDFFPSISEKMVHKAFSGIGYDGFAATLLTNLCTVNGALPQGSPCSPAISNIVCISLDKRLIGFCDKRGIRYTRYADDMYFSCDDKALLLRSYKSIVKIVDSEGFTINDKKTHYQTPSNKKLITGITVVTRHNDGSTELKAPKKLKKAIRAEIHKCIFSGDYSNTEHIVGEIAYVNYIERENKIKYSALINEYIEGLAKKICFFPELIEAYNNHRFAGCSVIDKACEICIESDEDKKRFLSVLEKRQEFIRREGIVDICKYANWPRELIAINTDGV